MFAKIAVLLLAAAAAFPARGHALRANRAAAEGEGGSDDPLPLAAFAASMVDAAEGRDVTLVSGNEAGDADSIVTALVYACLLQSKEDVLRGTRPIGYVNFLREDFPMRAETDIMLRNAGVDPSRLVFVDDPAASALLERAAQLVLTDHNEATGHLVPYGDRTVQIFDHHKDQGAYPWVTGEDRQIAFDEETGKATAASAATVVCEQYLARADGEALLAADGASIAQALLSVILIDGSNKLEADGGKLTGRDVDCLYDLHRIAGLSREESAALYQELDAAKKDPERWETYTAGQVLRYDFKQFASADGRRTVGISSCPSSLGSLSAREDWEESLAERAAMYDLYVVMTKTTNDEGVKEKELLLTACDQDLVDEAADFFAAYDDGLLRMEPVEVSPVPDYSLGFDQMNTGPGRKQVGPISQAFLDSLTGLPPCAPGSIHAAPRPRAGGVEATKS